MYMYLYMCVCALDMRNKMSTLDSDFAENFYKYISAETTIEISKLKAVIVTLHFIKLPADLWKIPYTQVWI